MAHNAKVWIVAILIVLTSALLCTLLPDPYGWMVSCLVGSIVGWNISNFLE